MLAREGQSDFASSTKPRSERPVALAPIPENVPAHLRRLPRWVNWQYQWKNDRYTKVPLRTDGGGNASTSNPETWSTFDDAMRRYQHSEGIDGIGFAIGEGLVGVDIDHCRNPETGELTPEAHTVISTLNTYSEISPSGTGIRAFALGELPAGGRKRDGFEMYDGGRYLTVTGHQIDGTPSTIERRDTELAAVHARWIAKPLVNPNPPVVQPPTGSGGNGLTDSQVLETMWRSKHGGRLRSLYDGDLSAHGGDHSAGDLALVSHFVWWTDGDAIQVDRLFRSSALMRDKWDQPRGAATYGEMTIREAMDSRRPGDGYRSPRPPRDVFVDPPVWDGPEPQPFPGIAVPLLPQGLLPEPLNRFALDRAERASILADCFLPGLIVSLAAVVGNWWRINPKELDSSWTVVPNVYGMIVNPPGQMKSPVLNSTVNFLRKVEDNELEEYEKTRIDREAEEKFLEIEIDVLEKQITAAFKKRVDPRPLKHQLIEAKRALEAARHKPPQLVTNDVTTEKLLELLRDNPRGLLLFRDELAGWYESLSKQGREGDRQFYLEAHNGDQPYLQQRISRGAIKIAQVTLSVLGGIQPARLRELQAGAMGAEADGLLQRFQILVWPDRPRAYRYDDRPEDTALKAEMLALYVALRTLTPYGFVDSEGQPLAFPEDPPFVLKFAPEAQTLFIVWLEELELMIRQPEMEHKPAWSGYLGKLRSLMPTLALLFHLVDMATGRTRCADVSLEATQRASDLTAYLMAHAEKVYQAEVESDGRIARLIAAKIATGAIRDGCTVREIYNAGWSDLDRQAVELGLKYLEELGWLRIEQLTSLKGGRPSVVVRLHPRAVEFANAAIE